MKTNLKGGIFVQSENIWYRDWKDMGEYGDGFVFGKNISIGSGSPPCESSEDFFSILRKEVVPPGAEPDVYYLDPFQSYSMHFRACNKILLKPNRFSVKDGAQFTAKIIENPIDCSSGNIQPMQLEGSIYYGADFCIDSKNPLRFRYNCADSYKVKVYDPTHNLALIHQQEGRVDEYGLVYSWTGEGANDISGLYYMTIEVTNATETKTYQYNIDARFYKCNRVFENLVVSPNPFNESVKVTFELRLRFC